jgi:hypothetical protein
MKLADDRLKLSITFDEYESRLIREAARLLFGKPYGPQMERKDCRMTITRAVMAFCRGVIFQKWRDVCPPVAVLRQENEIEQRERIAGKIPETGPAGMLGGDCNRWN